MSHCHINTIRAVLNPRETTLPTALEMPGPCPSPHHTLQDLGDGRSSGRGTRRSKAPASAEPSRGGGQRWGPALTPSLRPGQELGPSLPDGLG